MQEIRSSVPIMCTGFILEGLEMGNTAYIPYHLILSFQVFMIGNIEHSVQEEQRYMPVRIKGGLN